MTQTPEHASSAPAPVDALDSSNAQFNKKTTPKHGKAKLKGVCKVGIDTRIVWAAKLRGYAEKYKLSDKVADFLVHFYLDTTIGGDAFE